MAVRVHPHFQFRFSFLWEVAQSRKYRLIRLGGFDSLAVALRAEMIRMTLPSLR